MQLGIECTVRFVNALVVFRYSGKFGIRHKHKFRISFNILVPTGSEDGYRIAILQRGGAGGNGHLGLAIIFEGKDSAPIVRNQRFRLELMAARE